MKRSSHRANLALTAGLLWLAVSIPAQGQGSIRYVPNVNMVFPNGDTSWDVDRNGTPDFIFRFNGRSLGVFPQTGSHILALPAPPPDLGADVLPLAIPSEIGNYDYTPAQWIGSAGNLGFPGRAYFNSCSSLGCVGTFVGIKAFFGFNVEFEGQTHYGWADFNVSWGGPGGILTEYAYNLTPGASIFVGQVPEPGIIALITFGGGLLWWRFRRVRDSS